MDNPLKNIYYYSDSSRKLLIGIILLWISTLIHHLYGAYIYNTLWRAIAPTLLFPVLLIFTIKLFKNFIGTPKYWQKIFFTSTVLIIWIIPIGFMEGGYGHLLKNTLYYLDFNAETMHKLFPPEFGETRFFEVPNDIFFEISGILQFIIGLYTLLYLVKFINYIKND